MLLTNPFFEVDGDFLRGDKMDMLNAESYKKEVIDKIQGAKKYEKVLDKLLSEKNKKSVIELVNLCFQERFQDKVIASENLNYGVLLAMISIEELNYGFENLFAFQGKSLKDIRDIITKIKFCMWEIEFDEDEKAMDRLMHLVIYYELTPCVICKIIEFTSMNKKMMYETMLKVFENLGVDLYTKVIKENYELYKEYNYG